MYIYLYSYRNIWTWPAVMVSNGCNLISDPIITLQESQVTDICQKYHIFWLDCHFAMTDVATLTPRLCQLSSDSCKCDIWCRLETRGMIVIKYSRIWWVPYFIGFNSNHVTGAFTYIGSLCVPVYVVAMPGMFIFASMLILVHINNAGIYKY